MFLVVEQPDVAAFELLLLLPLPLFCSVGPAVDLSKSTADRLIKWHANFSLSSFSSWRLP